MSFAALAPMLSEAAAAFGASSALTDKLEAAVRTSSRIGDMSGTGGGSTYGLGGEVPGVFTKYIKYLKLVNPLLGAFSLGLKTAEKSVKALEDWGDSLLNSRRNLMAFNGTIAGTMMEAERRNMVRGMESGKATATTTLLMSEQLSEMKDQIQPFKDAMTNGYNLLAGAVMFGFNGVMQASLVSNGKLGTIARAVKLFNDRFGSGGGISPPMAAFIDAVQRGKLDDDAEADRELMGEAGWRGDFHH